MLNPYLLEMAKQAAATKLRIFRPTTVSASQVASSAAATKQKLLQQLEGGQTAPVPPTTVPASQEQSGGGPTAPVPPTTVPASQVASSAAATKQKLRQRLGMVRGGKSKDEQTDWSQYLPSMPWKSILGGALGGWLLNRMATSDANDVAQQQRLQQQRMLLHAQATAQQAALFGQAAAPINATAMQSHGYYY